MGGTRNIPTRRAREILERLVELNRIRSDRRPEGTAVGAEGERGDLALTPVRRRRLYEDVVQQLQTLISSGKLAVGDKLPSERSLAEQMAVRKDLEALKAAVISRQEEVLEGRPPLESDTDFHRALGAASRNEVLQQMLDTVLGLTSRRRQEFTQLDHGPILMLHQHVNIYRAVKNGEPEQASSFVSEHLRELGRHLGSV